MMTYTMLAVWRVDIKPHTMADKATLAMTFPREGASAPSTPIWIPRDPRLAKPQRQYEAIVKARGLNGEGPFVIA